MDCRLKAATLAAVILGIGVAAGGTAIAQDAEPQAGQAEPQAGTSVFGSEELPKGLTIVPWKKGDPGELTSGPTRLVEEPLEPIDPEEFQRRLDYYEQSGAE